jgi:hypothetical protein
MSNLVKYTPNDRDNTVKSEISQNQNIPMNCSQKNVECLKSFATISNFGRSEENFIEVVINFTAITKSVGE